MKTFLLFFILILFVSCDNKSVSFEEKSDVNNVSELEQIDIIKDAVLKHGQISIKLFENALELLNSENFSLLQYEQLFVSAGNEIEHLCQEIKYLPKINNQNLDKLLLEFNEHIEKFDSLSKQLSERINSEDEPQRTKLVLAEEDYKKASLRFGDILDQLFET